MKACTTAIALLVLSSTACDPAVEGNLRAVSSDVTSPLEGVWRIGEIHDQAPSGETVADPASVYIFTPTYYSMMRVNGAEPRPQFAAYPGTEAERLMAFATFSGSTGVYEIEGSTLTVRPTVAKNPNFMSGGFEQYDFRLAGDTLWLTERPGGWHIVVNGNTVAANADQAGDIVIKLVRVQ